MLESNRAGVADSSLRWNKVTADDPIHKGRRVYVVYYTVDSSICEYYFAYCENCFVKQDSLNAIRYVMTGIACS